MTRPPDPAAFLHAANPIASPATPFRRVLVVDDSRVQRKILSSLLGRWGYAVAEAPSAEVALDRCRADLPDLILSDWMMPGMSGLDLCGAVRALAGDRYPYIILLTSRAEKADIAQGLGRGADDFLTKPVDAGELRARMIAGERILAMHGVVTERNRTLHAALSQLEAIQRALDRDLEEARRLQQSLVPRRFHDHGTTTVSLLLEPSGHIGGDLVGVFPAGPDRIGFYGIDVAGHGIASALMTARLAGHFAGDTPDRNLALTTASDGAIVMRPPDEVCAILNRMAVAGFETGQYFTLLVGAHDLRSGHVRFAQAGHPPPLLQRADGGIDFLGDGGLPVGLVADASYTTLDLTLRPGDRLLVHSDGITECPGRDGAALDDQGLAAIAARNRTLRGPAFLDAVVRDLSGHAGGPDFADDVSAVLIERSANPSGEG
jgi:sigma-B regulation protein RsbU (phosphoserine phosphatase)